MESSDPTMNLAHQLLMGKDTAVTLFERNRFRSADSSVRNLPQRQRVIRVAQYQDHLILSHSKDEGARGHEVVNATMEV